MVALSPTDQHIVDAASRDSIELYLDKLRRYFTAGRWLGSNNRYRYQCIERLEDDSRQSSINGGHLAQYIAASTILHCADGWSYLGRCLDCQSRGDRNTALHLGYYAELRAAMSLLAAEGVGIFNRQHFVLDDRRRYRKIRCNIGTHEIIWPILEHWADRQETTDLLINIIKPLGIPLKFWIDAFSFSGAPSFRPIGSRWLKDWGLDLKRFAEDRRARNEASYRPANIDRYRSLSVLACSEFLASLWAMFEPSGASRFSTLDNHLLRLSLRQVFRAQRNRSILQAHSVFEARIDRMIRNVSPLVHFSDELRQFLLWQTDPEIPVLINEAYKPFKADDLSCHLQVASRAALLLRLATGACERLITRTSITRADLAFWWNPFGEGVGLWDLGNPPSDFLDLWADVEQAISDVGGWQTTIGGVSPSYHNWESSLSQTRAILGSCERVALWGFGI